MDIYNKIYCDSLLNPIVQPGGNPVMQISAEQIVANKIVTVIRLRGDFDLVGAQQFDQQISDMEESAASSILIDLSGVHFMSSAGIRSLNELFYTLHPYDQEKFRQEISPGIRSGTYRAPNLKLLKPSEMVANTLKMVGLDMYLEVFEDENTALQSFI
jgi:anti-anti-sigma factor